MRWDTFEEAFRLNREHALDTLIAWPFFFGFRETIGDGNCFGMSLLALEVCGDGSTRAPFSGELRGSVWSNYPPRTTSSGELPTTNDLRLDINTYQWRQMSVEYLRRALDAIVKSPMEQGEQIYQDSRSTNYQPGLLSITHRDTGHSLIVESCTKGATGSGSTRQTVYDLLLYDPNRPFVRGAGSRRYPHLQPMRIEGNRWSFTMANGDVWSSDDGVMTYVSFHDTGLWRKFPSNIVDVFIILLGDGTTAEQISDGQNRRLFRNPNPRSLAELDLSPRGLARDILPIVPLTQRPAIRPPVRLNDRAIVQPAETEIQSKFNQVMASKFGDSVRNSRKAYFGGNIRMQDLTVRLNTFGDSRVAPAMTVLHNNTIWEVQGAEGALLDVEIPAPANLAAGLRIRARDGNARLKKLSFGKLDSQGRSMTLQRVQNVPLTRDGVEVRITPEQTMMLQTSAATGPVLSLTRELIDVQGNVRSLGMQQIEIKAGAARSIKPPTIQPAEQPPRKRIRVRTPDRPKNS
jgi:hypothetical protein